MNAMPTIIESLVAALLVVTIIYCWMLNRRLTLLRQDEKMFHALLKDLVTVSNHAESSVADLKATIAHLDQALEQKMRTGRELGDRLDRSILAGQNVLDKVKSTPLESDLKDKSDTGEPAQAEKNEASTEIETPSSRPSIYDRVQAAVRRVQASHGLSSDDDYNDPIFADHDKAA